MNTKTELKNTDEMYGMVMSFDVIVGRMECIRRIAETMKDIEDCSSQEYELCGQAAQFILDECTRARAEFLAEVNKSYNPIMQ
jgi:hypothetical protein